MNKEDIREIRGEAGLTQKEFAAILGVSTNVVSKWELGKGKPNIKNTRKIEDFCSKNGILLGIDDVLKRYYKICDMKQAGEIIEDSFGDIYYDFIGFLEQYERLSKLIPKDWTIVDLGCANGFQAEYFRSHKKYIGVDINDEQKYQTANSEYLTMRIKEFLGSENFKRLNLDKTFAICNYVPCQTEVAMAREKFKSIFVYYPA